MKVSLMNIRKIYNISIVIDLNAKKFKDIIFISI